MSYESDETARIRKQLLESVARDKKREELWKRLEGLDQDDLELIARMINEQLHDDD